MAPTDVVPLAATTVYPLPGPHEDKKEAVALVLPPPPPQQQQPSRRGACGKEAAEVTVSVEEREHYMCPVAAV